MARCCRPWREIKNCKWDVIDDSYNANPDSVRAAIDLLSSAPSPRVLVLGDMGEVGTRGPEFHREVGVMRVSAVLRRYLALARRCVKPWQAFGNDAHHFDDIDSLISALRARSASNGTVLVKGSRFMRMERVVQALTAQQSEKAH